ncbi:MAG: hypothetical protein AAGA32_00945 [Pseudomonadota bacterium]
MVSTIDFAPLLPWPFIAALTGLALALVVFALWRGLAGWWLRGFAVLVLAVALSEPSLREEDRTLLPDIAFLVIDETDSQAIDVRPEQIAEAQALLETQFAESAAERPLDLRMIRVANASGEAAERGTLLLSALAEAAAEVSQDRIAGAVLLTDGQVHDPDVVTSFPGPVHTLLTGRTGEWDRRVVLKTAPSFAIVGEPVEIQLEVESMGAAPEEETLPLLVSLDGADPQVFRIAPDTRVTIPLTLEKGGLNVLSLTVPDGEGELTERNNTAVVSINGIRDRLRVLLVSGEPYAGERTWRNILKSDPAVDLVHFTILRPPEKQDGVPVFELSLIAFPTRELFMDKVDEFDLIIFDRYRRRGVLPSLYIDNIRRYVEDGGAVLIASGPAFAGAESLYRTPLREILPAEPTARVIEEGYHPRISELGQRHPVTRGLEDYAPRPVAEDGTPGWGRWFRLIEMEQSSGHAVMEGVDGRPVLVLDRPGDGRIAMLASDHAWLWSRGFEGGGPKSELLRRLAHWLMQEPELEEEVLTAAPDGAEITVTRRSLGETVGDLTVRLPSGATETLTLQQVAPGVWQAQVAAPENGIYRLTEGRTSVVTAVGPSAPREFETPISSDIHLAALSEATGGGVLRLEEAVPAVRRVAEGRVAHGRGWIGLARRDAFDVRDIRLTPLAPGWLMLLLSGMLLVLAWRVEGR